MKPRWLYIVGVMTVLLAACAGSRPAGQPAQAETVRAFIGDLSASATASGKVLPRRQATVALETAGRVEEVLVGAGDAVLAGDVLVQLESEDLAFALESARQDLIVREANLENLQTPPTEEEIAAAEAAVTSAQAQLDDLLDGPRPEEIAAAEANVRAAESGIWSASEQLDQAQSGPAAAQIARARANVASAELELLQAQQANEDNPNGETHQAMLDAQEALEIAQAKLDDLLAGANPDSVAAARADVGAAAARRDAQEADLSLMLSGASEAEIASAEASLAQAEASLVSLQDGPTDEEVRIAQTQVEQARLAVEDAEAALADATLRAPFDGVVTAVHVTAGEFASGAAVDLMATDSLEVVLTVDEADIGKLEVGQPAVITLQTWPEEEIDTEIVKIAPGASSGGGDALVSYEVFLALGDTALPVRAGMTADARLQTAQREDVLLVPNRAIIADRQEGNYYVNLLVPGDDGQEGEQQVEQIEVTIGLRDDENTQILSGLEEGDLLRVTSAVPTFVPGEGNGEGPPFGNE